MKISAETTKRLMEDNSIGYCCFMGGVNSDAELVIFETHDETFLFSREERKLTNPEYLEVVNKQNQEAKEYAEMHESYERGRIVD